MTLILKSSAEGNFDDYLNNYAAKIKAFREPVFIRFAHNADNPAYSWSVTGGNTPGDFIDAWRHVVLLFNEAGVSNVAWVWNPWKAVMYYTQWKKYIKAHKGQNIGGIVYSWRDRLEGSVTWFGVTDFDGNIKPSYYSLQWAWTGFKDTHKLHDAFIAGPGVELKPGQVYEFKAVSENNLHKALKFEWSMCRDEFIYYKGELEPSSDGHRVRVRIPEEPSNYRLYLKIKNDDGNVVSASVPVRVKKEKIDEKPELNAFLQLCTRLK
jgi:hypothetical protein